MKTAVILTIGLLVFVGLVQVFAAKRERDAAADFPPEGQILTVDGVAVHAVQAGTGPDLVLIHGASGNTRDWTFDFVDRVKDRYRVTVLDRPGMGWTGQISAEDTHAFSTAHANPVQQAQLLQAAAAQLGVRDPIVVGHSFGGIVGYAWALDVGGLSGFVSVAGVANPWPGTLDWTYRVNGSALGGGLVVPVLSAFVPQGYIDAAVENIFAPQSAPVGLLLHLPYNLYFMH